MADSDDQSEFSGNEFIDDVGEFDLVDVNNRTRTDLERLWRNIVGDSDDEDDEFDGFDPEDAYVVPEFVEEKRASTSCIFQASWTHKSA